MILSDATDNQGLIQDARFLTDTTSADFPEKHVIRLINHWLNVVYGWIDEASGDWQVDDKNNTDLPVATTTIVNGQSQYQLPGTLVKLDQVNILDTNGDYHKVLPLDKSQFPETPSEFETPSGFPLYYDVYGDALNLYPAPNTSVVTASDGLKIFYVRDAVLFAASGDDAESPGFGPKECHRILSLGAALDYSLAKSGSFTENYRDGLREQISILKKTLQSSNGDKNKGFDSRIRPKRNNYI